MSTASDDGAAEELSPVEASTTAQDPPPTWLEWSVRLGSLACIVALFGYLVVSALTSRAPAEIVVDGDPSAIEKRGDEWLVPARVENVGGVSVAEVVVTATLVDGSGTSLESEDVNVPLLGAGSHAEVHFWFSDDPHGAVEFTVGSYTIP